MPKLLCQIGRHRPALVVVRYEDDRPVAAPVCARCGRVTAADS